jgi:hypothetical protein
MSNQIDVFSKCGMNCARCPWSHYIRETFETDDDFQQFRDKCKEILGYRPTETPCLTCGTPDEELPKGAKLPLRNCLIRQCVTRMGIENCAYCSRFPCGYVKDIGTLWTREKFEARKGEPISEDEYLTFIEPFEGLAHLEEICKTLNPEDIVEPITVPPLRARIVDFPEDLSLSEEKIKTFRSLYHLLATIKRSSLGLEGTDTYAQHMRLKDWKKHLFRFLWIFGRFGEMKEKEAFLAVDSTTYTANRGSEKSLSIWSFVKNTIFERLEEFGIHCEQVLLEEGKKKGATTPTGYLRDKGWFMTLTVDDTVGGAPVLTALQTYAAVLDEQYGKRAFQYFSAIDMRVLK